MANGGSGRTITTRLVLDTSGYVAGANRAISSNQQLRNSTVQSQGQASHAIDATTSQMTRMRTVVGGIVASGAFLALGQQALQAFTQIRDDASNLNESINAVNVVFGESADQILQFGSTADQSMGLSQRAFNEAAVQFSNFADVIASDGRSSAEVVEEMTARASDFASVHNLEVQEALRLFQSGLAGETEPLRRYGILLSEAEVKAHAYAEGIATAGGELTEQEKVLARYSLIMQETSNTQGDFANTADDYANAQRRATAEAENARAELGQALLPILAAISDVMSNVLIGFQELPEPLQVTTAGIVVLGAVAATGASAMRTLGISAQFALRALGPIGIALAVGGAIIGGLGLLGSTSEEASGNVESLAQTLERGTGAITNATREAVLLELQQKGLADQARDLNIATKDLVGAYLGEEEALQRVNGALEDIIEAGTEMERRRHGSGFIEVEVLNEEAKAATELQEAIKAGNVTTEEAVRLAKELGVVIGETGDAVSGFSEDVMEIAESWRTAIQDMVSANDALSDANADLREDEELTTQAFLDAYERRVEIARNHNANIVEIQNRASDDVRDQLLEDAQENPELAQVMVDATDKQWARMEDLYRQRTEEATKASRDAMIRETPALTSVAENMGIEFARGLAQKIEEGGHLSVTEARNIYNNIDAEFQDDIIAQISPLMSEFNYSRVLNQINDLTSPRTLWVTPSLTDSSIHITGRGIAGSIADGGWVPGYEGGGRVFGPVDGRAGGTVTLGTGPRSDDVLALVSRGEFVVNARDAAANREMLQRINQGQMPRYQSGGEVEMFERINRQIGRFQFSRPPSTPASTSPGAPVYNVNGPLMEVQAWSDRFSLKQIQDELSLRGSI